MKKEVFYLLGSKWDGCHTPYANDELFNLHWHCKNCGHPLEGVKQIDAMIKRAEDLIKQKPLSFTWDYCSIYMAWEPFIRAVPSYILDRDMFFGNVFGLDQKRIEGWLTCRCRYNLFLRGTKDISPVTICKDCEYIRYWAHIKPHLYPAPPEDADIFQCGHGILFRESVFQYLDMGQWRKKVYVTKISVADKPLDGLELPPFEIPRDLNWVAEHPELKRI